MTIVPIERCGVWTKVIPARNKQRLSMHDVVVTSVFELFTDSWANFKSVVWRHCYVAKIEQTMNVSPQQQPV